MSRPTNSLALFCAVVLLGFFSGCGGRVDGDAGIREANKTNIQRLTNLYSRHQLFHAGKGPASEQEFRKYIGSLDAETLKKIGVDAANLDKLFISERDGQPFKVVYNVTGSTRGSNDAVVFEQNGKDGVKEVGFTSLTVKKLNDSEISALQSGKPAGGNPQNTQLPPGAGR
jgi:hypothetical protein